MKSLMVFASILIGSYTYGQIDYWKRIEVEKNSSDYVIGSFATNPQLPGDVFIVTKKGGVLQFDPNYFEPITTPFNLIGLALDTVNEHFDFLEQSSLVKVLDSNQNVLIYSNSSNFSAQLFIDTAGLPKNLQTNWLLPIESFIQSDYNNLFAKFKNGQIFTKTLLDSSWTEIQKPQVINSDYTFPLYNGSLISINQDSIYSSTDNGATWIGYRDSLMTTDFTLDTAYAILDNQQAILIGHDQNNYNRILHFNVGPQNQIYSGELLDSALNPLNSLGNVRKLWNYHVPSMYPNNFLIFDGDTIENQIPISFSPDYQPYQPDYGISYDTIGARVFHPKSINVSLQFYMNAYFHLLHVENYGVYYRFHTYSSITENSKTSLSIHPNPAQTFFELPDELIVQSIEITDLYGRSTTLNRSDDNHYDISRLTPGYYIVKVLDQAGNYSTGKLIIR